MGLPYRRVVMAGGPSGCLKTSEPMDLFVHVLAFERFWWGSQSCQRDGNSIVLISTFGVRLNEISDFPISPYLVV